MIKYLFLFVFVFFLQGLVRVYSQTGGDSVVKVEMNDSAATESGDSIEKAEYNSDGPYKPMADGSYLFSDTVRQVSAHQVRSYLLNPDYAYANDPEYWKKEAPQKPGIFFSILNSRLLRWILFLGLIGVVLIGVYQLARENNFSWLYRSGKQISSEQEELLPVEEMDYDAAIRNYQGEGNYRLAVRYMYLRLIRTAREKSAVPFRDSSTNAEIARAFGNHPQAGEFRFLAMAYEYIFYGGFIPKQELFDTLKNKFEALQQSLSA